MQRLQRDRGRGASKEPVGIVETDAASLGRLWRRARARSPPARPIAFQLRIDLEGHTPPVWRRVVVPASFTFEDLHRVIQQVFGWQDAHKHEFEVNAERIGDPKSREEDPMGILGRAMDGSTKPLHEPLGPEGTRFRYTCNVHGGREHRVLVEKAVREDDGLRLPRVTAGRRPVPQGSATESRPRQRSKGRNTGSREKPLDVQQLDRDLEPLRRSWARRRKKRE